MPPYHVLPEPTSAHPVAARAQAELSLTLRGVRAVGSEHKLDVFLRALRHIGKQAATFIPSHDGMTELTVTSAEARARPDATPRSPHWPSRGS